MECADPFAPFSCHGEIVGVSADKKHFYEEFTEGKS